MLPRHDPPGEPLRLEVTDSDGDGRTAAHRSLCAGGCDGLSSAELLLGLLFGKWQLEQREFYGEVEVSRPNISILNIDS